MSSPQSATSPDQLLLSRIHERHEQLSSLLAEISNAWVSEDLVYRFWHQSFKVYSLQEATIRILRALEGLCADGMNLHPWFVEIVAAGTNKKFELSHNEAWLEHAKPVVDAFFHARFMLEMVVSAGSMESAPSMLPSGWAAVLELYQIR